MESYSTSNDAQSLKSRALNAPIKFVDQFFCQGADQVGHFSETGVTYEHTGILHLNSLTSSNRIIRLTSMDYLELVTCSGFYAWNHLEARSFTNAVKVPICKPCPFSPWQMMGKQKEGASGATSAGPSGGTNSGSSSSSEPTESSTDETEKGDNKDEEKNDSSSSNENPPPEKGSPATAVPVIPLVERTVDGTFVRRALLRTDAFSGYGSLARLVRQYSPYNTPDSMVHILWPWVEHTAVYFGRDDRVLNPRARWEDFESKLTEIHMFPMEASRPALSFLPGIPMNLPGIPPLDVGPFYWFRFQQPSTPTRILVIRRSAISSYRGFFWIINGLWASWRGKEPLDAEMVTEANVVQEGNDFVLRRPDTIKFFDHYGKELKLPRFLVARKRLEARRQRRLRSNRRSLDEEGDTDTSEEESNDEDESSDEENYPNDINYESTWDFLTQVLQAVITWSSQQPTP